MCKCMRSLLLCICFDLFVYLLIDFLVLKVIVCLYNSNIYAALDSFFFFVVFSFENNHIIYMIILFILNIQNFQLKILMFLFENYKKK